MVWAKLCDQAVDISSDFNVKEIRKFLKNLSESEFRDSRIAEKLFSEISGKFTQLTPLSCASLAESFARLKMINQDSTQLLCLAYENSVRHLLRSGNEDVEVYLPQTFTFFQVLKKVLKFKPPPSTVELAVEIFRKFPGNSADHVVFIRNLWVLGFSDEAARAFEVFPDLEISTPEVLSTFTEIFGNHPRIEAAKNSVKNVELLNSLILKQKPGNSYSQLAVHSSEFSGKLLH